MGDKEKKNESSSNYKPPKGHKKEIKCQINSGKEIKIKVQGDWIVLKKNEKPVAEMYFTSYTAESEKNRPLTFVFNGGPGAASAYLHVGGVGPKIIEMNDEGGVLKPPARLKDNPDTWLSFTDLVFVDPVGTGFSRALDEIDKSEPFNEADKDKKSEIKPSKEYYKLQKDLDSLGEFIAKYLSEHKRWSSPIFIAGESYGGFRVAKLMKLLQEGYGVGLNGAILISPCIDWNALNSNDYDVLNWVTLYPSLVAAASFHGKSKAFKKGESFEKIIEESEKFAGGEMAMVLTQGDICSASDQDKVWNKMSEDLGLSKDLIAKCRGRISLMKFARELLREDHLWTGLYDASITSIDAFPDRENFESPDPTLFSIERVFCAGINSLLREVLEVECDRDYRLLNFEVNQVWQVDTKSHAFDLSVGGADDMRYAMVLNPFMKVSIVHGVYDLVTPYYSSKRIVDNMRLDPRIKDNLTMTNYGGGHMFYTWKDSREKFSRDMEKFFKSSL